MTTLNVSLPDEMKEFVEAQMLAEGYASASEYLRSLIRAAQKRRAKQALEAKFREALDSSPATPMTREDWDSVELEALDRWTREQASRGAR
jgi:antitoxin ParD1/3/4